ncbi:MAG: DNA-binding domain-containing protein, partial [Nitrosospira sp.]
QQSFVDALLDPEQLSPVGLITWNGSDPAARFAVYRNNVVASLIDALADTFPVTQKLVGEVFFRAMARLFISAQPPRSRVLAFYGVSFPAFIEHFPPAASVPYLADVARLEMLWVQAYHAANNVKLSANAIASALTDADELPHLRIGLQSSVGLVRSRYAVISLWAAHQGVADISTIDPYAPENALVFRPHLDVEMISLNAGASDFVAHLLLGASLSSAAEQARLNHADLDLAGILGLLFRQHAISSMKTSSRTHV